MASLSKLSFQPDSQELGESIEKLGRFEKMSSQSLLRVAGILGVSGPVFSIVKALTNFR
jgi:hypothetical protein